MTRRVLALAVLGALVWMAADSRDVSAFGRKKASCAPAPSCGYTPGCGAAPCGEVAYEDREVTVMEMQPTKEKFKYYECVPTQEKVKVKVCVTKSREEAFDYYVNKMVQEKQTIKVCKTVMVEEEVKYVSVSYTPKTEKQKRTVYECVCVPVTTVKQVPVYKTVMVAPACDPCAVPCAPAADCGKRRGLFGGLCGKKSSSSCAAPAPTCVRVCEMQTVSCTVMQYQRVEKVIDVDVTTYTRVETPGTRKVQVCKQAMVDQDVMVWKCVQEKQTGKRTVYFTEMEDREVMVTKMVQAERDGERTVYKCVPVKKMVKVAVYKPAPVVVPAPCAQPCAAPCSTSYAAPCGNSGGRQRRGLCSPCR